LGAVTISVLLQILVVQTPFFNKFLKTVPLGLNDWMLVVLVSSSVFVVVEIYKFIVRRNWPHHAL
jgi:P-type Ca2+ transporter type 2C